MKVGDLVKMPGSLHNEISGAECVGVVTRTEPDGINRGTPHLHRIRVVWLQDLEYSRPKFANLHAASLGVCRKGGARHGLLQLVEDLLRLPRDTDADGHAVALRRPHDGLCAILDEAAGHGRGRRARLERSGDGLDGGG